jgi:hypothetical protein
MIVFLVLALAVLGVLLACKPTSHWTTYSLDADEYRRLQEHLNGLKR